MLGRVAANDLPTRMAAVAKEIAAAGPDLVGLQEAFRFTFDAGSGPTTGPRPFRDAVDDLLTALRAEGVSYEVAATVVNLDLSVPGVPLPGLGVVTVGVTDRDVILRRAGVEATPVPFACARPSADGCRYSVNLPVDLPAPLPDTAAYRGFVAVDARVRGELYRFVNTHLEVRRAGGLDVSAVQAAQAQELLTVLQAETPPARPIVLVGDLNSGSSNGPAAPYGQITSALFRDVWLTNLLANVEGDGFTCCQEEDLSNEASALDERIDYVLVRNTLGALPFSVVGPVFAKRTGATPIGGAAPRWSSDHAGVAVSLPAIPVARAR